ncbi:GNAT family N-acetyltransferase, partial [Escherichia coli]|nr:GNAT family N-acetyltransferase [Escherichia coli]
MKNKVTIRAYQASDNAVLSDIWFRASCRAHAFLGEARLAQQRRLIEQTYLPDAETWVALIDGEPVGFIGLLESFIGGLFVDPRHHGAGIGQALVAHALGLKGELSLQVYA